MKRILLRGRSALLPEEALVRLGCVISGANLNYRPTVVTAHNFSCWYSVYLLSKNQVSIEVCGTGRNNRRSVFVGTLGEVDEILARRIVRKGLIIEVNPGQPGKLLAKMPRVTALLVADELSGDHDFVKLGEGAV